MHTGSAVPMTRAVLSLGANLTTGDLSIAAFYSYNRLRFPIRFAAAHQGGDELALSVRVRAEGHRVLPIARQHVCLPVGHDSNDSRRSLRRRVKRSKVLADGIENGPCGLT